MHALILFWSHHTSRNKRLETCLPHILDADAERARMFELNSDDELPLHGLPRDAKTYMVQCASQNSRLVFGLLKCDKWEAACDLLRSFGEALCKPEPAPACDSQGSDDDDNMNGTG